MTIRIPLELIFYTISFLQDNKAALSVCSLCCSALATFSRSLLFHTLRSGTTPLPNRFERILESGSGLLPFIKRIDVAVATRDDNIDQHTIAVISQIMGHRCVQDTPPALKIAIRPVGHVVPSRCFPMKSLLPLDPVAHWVTCLELDQVWFSRGVQFWDTVLEFPKLKTLILGCLGCMDGGPISSHHKSEISHISLKTPAFEGRHNTCLFLAQHPLPLPSLTSLDVRLPAVLDRTPIRFGEVYGRTVRTLRFGVADALHPINMWDKLARKF